MRFRILIFIVVVFVLYSGAFLWYREALSPVNDTNSTTSLFVISKGEAIREIANNLKDQNFIRDPLAFFILVKLQNVERNIQAGDFRLSTVMSANEILDELQHGTVDIWVTSLEGWRSEEIALELAQELSIPESEFLKYSQEGYMFPDTYLFPKQASGSAVAKKMRNTFDEKVTISLQEQITNSPYSLHEIVTIASLVEREALYDEERPLVASVLINRLSIGMKLDIDATIQYVLGYQTAEKDWWKKALSYEDLKIVSPYNTYIYSGLPPGPIANPGLTSILAVLNPAETDYLYYLHDQNGHIHLAKTYEEHQNNISQYLK